MGKGELMEQAQAGGLGPAQTSTLEGDRPTT
jgi:hypothetical protein